MLKYTLRDSHSSESLLSLCAAWKLIYFKHWSYIPALLSFQLLLHSPVDTPKISEFGSLIAPGREYRIKITPTINNATRSLRYMKEAARQCAYSGERYLQFYRTYTQKHCSLECEANFTFQVCECVPFYLPSTYAWTSCCFIFLRSLFSDSSFLQFYFSLLFVRFLPFPF